MKMCFWAPSLSLIKRPYEDDPQFLPCAHPSDITDVFVRYGIPREQSTRHPHGVSWPTGQQRRLSTTEIKLIKRGDTPKVELGLDHEAMPALRFSRDVVKGEIIGAVCCSVERVIPGEYDSCNLDHVVRQCLRVKIEHKQASYEFRPDKGTNVLVFIRPNDLGLASDTVKLCIFVIEKLPYLVAVAKEAWPVGTMLVSQWGNDVTAQLLSTLVWVQAGHSHNALIYEQTLQDLTGTEYEEKFVDHVDIGEEKWLHYVSDPTGLLPMKRQLAINEHRPRVGSDATLTLAEIATVLSVEKQEEEAYIATNCTKIDRTVVPKEIRSLILDITDEKPSYKRDDLFGKFKSEFIKLLGAGNDSPVTELRRVEWIHHPLSWVNVPDRPQYAVYSTHAIKPGQPILVYKGALVRSQGDFDPNGTYAFDLDCGISVDASNVGNQARFVNDDWERPEEGNAEYSVVWDDDDDVPVLVISAKEGPAFSEGIASGTEIIACYGEKYWGPRLKKLVGYQAQFYVATMARVAALQDTLRARRERVPARPSWNQLLLRREGHFFAPIKRRPPALSRARDKTFGDPEMEVDRLIDKKVQHGVTYYLVRWKKYDASHDSWEPADSIQGDTLIKDYEQANGGK